MELRSVVWAEPKATTPPPVLSTSVQPAIVTTDPERTRIVPLPAEHTFPSKRLFRTVPGPLRRTALPSLIASFARKRQRSTITRPESNLATAPV